VPYFRAHWLSLVVPTHVLGMVRAVRRIFVLVILNGMVERPIVHNVFVLTALLGQTKRMLLTLHINKQNARILEFVIARQATVNALLGSLAMLVNALPVQTIVLDTVFAAQLLIYLCTKVRTMTARALSLEMDWELRILIGTKTRFNYANAILASLVPIVL